MQTLNCGLTEEYLSAHYELLREDAVRALRDAVQHVRTNPQAKEDAFNGSIGIYEKVSIGTTCPKYDTLLTPLQVHICAVKTSPRGVATTVTFSLFRAGKKIIWEQSKRLVAGGLVVLTPADDQFKTAAIVATVAARPLEGLRQNPPEIELFIARADEQELDPSKEFWMIEHRGSMYEADRHTLLALQRMMREPFPLHEHLLDVEATVSAPAYVKANPINDMTAVLINNKHETYETVDILQDWPAEAHSDLDNSQLAALQRILTKRLAIVQGPPGTGKTFISVQAVKVMLANRKDDDPPIIIACQTNHAVDQLLRHIAEFEPDFIRLGGRSKDKGVVKARTLYEVRKQTSQNPIAGSLKGPARKKMRALEKEFKLLLSPLDNHQKPLDHHLLSRIGILSPQQAESLQVGASEWVQSTLSNPNEAVRSPFFVWLTDKLKPVPAKQQAEDFGFEYEEADLEFEQLKDMEAENSNKDDEDLEELAGQSFTIADNYTCTTKAGVAITKTYHDAQHALREQDMWKIPEAARAAVYRYLQCEMKKQLLVLFRGKAEQYNRLAEQRRIGTLEEHETVLIKQKIIGMTTTGLSKYRGLLAAMKPKIVLIEEAAEVMEAPVAVSCLPSLQHLILVGDHKQLRPHCNMKSHEDKPFYLNVSLFERMVNNQVEYDTLAKQRRMIPEIRRVLHPIYKNVIKDHASVLDPAKRPPVPGMGGVNSWFFTHKWMEQRDEQSSAFNPMEADMIVGFVKYLVFNGLDDNNITLLTFYNGQRKKLLRELRNDSELRDRRFNVVTVDSYQGEENEVVILSLVRSNDYGQIGFLNIDNRVCVALSRAKCGFYIFGNGELLYNSKTWNKVIKIMANQGPAADRLKAEPTCRLGEMFPVRCKNHNELTQISDATDWTTIVGGCERKCDEKMPCGHACRLTCHPFAHDMINCTELCGKLLPCCMRPCEVQCGEPCVCKGCKGKTAAVDTVSLPISNVKSDRGKVARPSSAFSWNVFAKEEPERYSEAVAFSDVSPPGIPQEDLPGSARCSHAQRLQNEGEARSLVVLSDFNQLDLEEGKTDRALPKPASPLKKAVAPHERKVAPRPESGRATELITHKDWSREGSLLD